MSKSCFFSIYLLKKGFNSDNALKDDHSLVPMEETETNLPDNAKMFIADNQRTSPWWKAYWGIRQTLNEERKGAIVFIIIEDRCMALTYGSAYHQLKDYAYEYDFGLRTTLNALDPKKIKSTDILQPESAKRQRIQVPVAAELSYFDFLYDENIIKRLTGAVKEEYRNLFNSITGGSSLRFSSAVPPDKITVLCQTLLKIYIKEDYKKSFPDIQNVKPVKDPETIHKLDDILLNAFAENSEKLMLTIPIIIDFDKAFSVKYLGEGSSNYVYEDVTIDGYKEYLDDKHVSISNVKKLYNHRIVLIDENGDNMSEFSIYKSIIFECELDNNIYHLCDGDWFLIEKDLIKKLKSFIDPYCNEDIDFLTAYENVDGENNEGKYNKNIGDNNDAIICLDKKNIAPTGQTSVEPCDLITIKNRADDGDFIYLVHIKISTCSASLSHLFNQGVNSVELLKLEKESSMKLKDLVANKTEYVELINKEKYCVVFGIITDKNREGKSNNLPIFSRISLMRALKSLKLMSVPCVVFFIDNKSTKK